MSVLTIIDIIILYLGRALGTYLIVGVNSDDTIIACKGPPVCGDRERIATVKGTN